MDGSLVIMEGSLLLRFLVFHCRVALSLWKDSVVEDFDSPMDGSLIIMEGSLFTRYLLLQWMVALSLWKVVCCRGF